MGLSQLLFPRSLVKSQKPEFANGRTGSLEKKLSILALNVEMLGWELYCWRVESTDPSGAHSKGWQSVPCEGGLKLLKEGLVGMHRVHLSQDLSDLHAGRRWLPRIQRRHGY